MHKFQLIEKFGVKERRLVMDLESTVKEVGKVVGGAEATWDKVTGAFGKGREAAKAEPEVPVAAPAATPAAAPATPSVVAAMAAADGAVTVTPVVASTEAGKPVAPVVAKVEAPAGASDASKVEAPAAPEAAKKEVKDATTRDLAGLQEEIQKGPDAAVFEKYLAEAEKIKGKVFEVKGKASALDFDAQKQRIHNEIYAAYNGADFSGLKDILGVKDDAKGDLVKDVVSWALANSFINKAKEETKYYADFLKTKAGENLGNSDIKATFSYGDKSVSVKVTGGEKFDTDYAAFVKTKPAEKKDEKASDVALKTEAEKLDYMAKTKIGKLMKLLGVDFKKVLSGDSPLAAAVFLLLGFGPKLGLAGGTDFLEGVPDVGGMGGIKKFAKDLAGKSDYGYEKNKSTIDESTLGVAAASQYEKVDEAKFLDLIAKKTKMPQQGIILEKEFSLNGSGAHPQNMEFDFGGMDGSAEIILPAGAKLTVNGNEVVAPKGNAKTFNKDTAEVTANKGIVVLTGIIPAGVVFKGGGLIEKKKE